MQDMEHHRHFAIAPLFGAEEGLEMDALMFAVVPVRFGQVQGDRFGRGRRRREVVDAVLPFIVGKPGLFCQRFRHVRQYRCGLSQIITERFRHGKNL